MLIACPEDRRMSSDWQVLKCCGMDLIDRTEQTHNHCQHMFGTTHTTDIDEPLLDRNLRIERRCPLARLSDS